MKRFSGFIPASNAVTFTVSQPLSIGDYSNYFILVSFTGVDVVGSAKLQYTDDTTLGPWVDIPSSTQAVTASGAIAWNSSVTNYPFVRVNWTYTSGTGNILGRATIREFAIYKGA